ncbi:ROK family glucokinase [Oceanivirga miroungae]|uniref:ROK family glucokinase n=2 Tax=Oceanivirga miroungae TaxID=1130046 RepID=A0A6I8MED2_9FUSO|nr:ROK family glucokinase [Oceanivirga miroungae]
MSDNEYKVLDLILKNSKMSQVELSKNIGISKAAISKIVNKLKEQNIVSEILVNEIKKKGRPKQYLVINKLDKKIIGINFGKDYFEISLGNIKGELLKTRLKKFFLKKSMSIVNILLEELTLFLEEVKDFEIIGVGICINAIVDSKKGIIINHPYFRWENLNLVEIIESRYKIPVVIDNNVRSILKAEIHFTQLKKYKDILYIYINDGIYSSIMINNKILVGKNMHSGQIAHYKPVNTDNKSCECGKRGCINSMYSENSILLKLEEEYDKYNKKLEINNMYDLYEKISKKSEIAKKIISDISIEVGQVVGNILNILDIENIIIAGDITYSGDIFLDGFNKGIKENYINDIAKIEYSKLGKNIEKKAAFNLVIENVFDKLKLFKE